MKQKVAGIAAASEAYKVGVARELLTEEAVTLFSLQDGLGDDW